ncbi:hypothetical protein GCM10023152_02440 [Agromyces bauzanensis]|uniref:Cation-transporting P-type ATPase N-terminal domain-containing protein n=2 Tax=Agromyces bauzanensis TaxID=1308924 RepID=A0A917PFA8_9MICO|nr:hypothetical protein GCM10011372_10830 [Agromyces bauzanensis]
MLILIVATIISMLVGDPTDGSIIIAILLASGILGFTQEFRANNDVAALLARVEVKVPVIRGGREIDVPVAEVVPGDLVQLGAGASCRPTADSLSARTCSSTSRRSRGSRSRPRRMPRFRCHPTPR